VSAATVRRRLSIVSGFFAFLQARGDVAANPVPRGLPTRRERSRPGQGVPLVRAVRRLPRILAPAEVDALMAALRTHRDRAMVAAMVLGGLRRCEVLGLRLEDLRFAERRVFIAEGKGGRQRLIPVSGRFFAAVAAYLDAERPPGSDRVFVVLQGPHRGQPLMAKGMDVVLAAARRRAGLDHATCHELRHTCLTRLREAGMALEAVQAQAGHASIESTRIYLHLADDWLAAQYRKAAEVIDAQVFAGQPAAPVPGSRRGTPRRARPRQCRRRCRLAPGRCRRQDGTRLAGPAGMASRLAGTPPPRARHDLLGLAVRPADRWSRRGRGRAFHGCPSRGQATRRSGHPVPPRRSAD
jgi:integrase